MKAQETSEYNVIDAIANKDATAADIEEILRKRGINSVADVIDQLRKDAAKQDGRAQSAKTAVDFRRFTVPDDYRPSSATTHRVPAIPILVDRVLIDPSDIKRFDGQELHLVVAPDQKSMIGITDRRVVSKWWEMTYITAMLGRSLAGVGGGRGAPEVSTEPGKAYSHGRPDPSCDYYEHPDYQGSSISHEANRGFADLTAVHSGVLGWGDSWNDRISSLIVANMSICVLHEHVFWAGNTIAFQPTPLSSPEGPPSYATMWVRELGSFGWNDVASSVEGW
jgi:hypothetical protein